MCCLITSIYFLVFFMHYFVFNETVSHPVSPSSHSSLNDSSGQLNTCTDIPGGGEMSVLKRRDLIYYCSWWPSVLSEMRKILGKVILGSYDGPEKESSINPSSSRCFGFVLFFLTVYF